MAVFKFNANQHEPAKPSQPVPPNWYTVAMTHSKIEPTKDGKGKRLNCIYQILEGQFKGKNVYEGYNIVNNNEQTVEIAMGQISALCRAMNKLTFQDSAELHNIPFLMLLDVQAKTEKFRARNTIEDVKPLNAGKTPNSVNGTASAAATPPSEGSTDSDEAPWDRAPEQ